MYESVYYFLNDAAKLAVTILGGVMFFPDSMKRRDNKRAVMVTGTGSFILLLLHAMMFVKSEWYSFGLHILFYVILPYLALVWMIVCYKAKPIRYIFNYCCAVLCQHGISRIFGIPVKLGIFAECSAQALEMQLIYIPYYLFLYYLIGKHIKHDENYRPDRNYTLSMLVLIIITFPVSYLEDGIYHISHKWYVFFCMGEALYCLSGIVFMYCIYVGSVRMAELRAQNILLEERRTQQQQLQSVMDAMNLKIHDLKHQLYYLENGKEKDAEVLKELQKQISEFQSFYQTGNPSLDVILTDKALLCQQNGIHFECGIQNGRDYEFLSIQDLSSLFGNILDNAVEYLKSIKDEKNRFLILRSYTQGEMLKLSAENYFEGTVEWKEDGCPRTTKGDTVNHGYGTESIRNIVENNHGNLVFKTEDHLFKVQILFM